MRIHRRRRNLEDQIEDPPPDRPKPGIYITSTPDTPISSKVLSGVAEPLVDVTNKELGLPSVSGPVN